MKNMNEEAIDDSTSIGQPSDDNVDDTKEFSIPQRFTKSGRKKAVPFPIKLMKVLSNKDFEHIISWTPSGKSFSIIEPKAFVTDILPEHFKSAKYASFTRKLHRWGFMRHYRGEEAGGFYHKLFQKDRLDLVEKMTCHKMEPQATQAVHKASKAPEVAPRPVQTSAQNMVNGPNGQQRTPANLSQDMISQFQNRLSLLSLQDGQLEAAERLNAAIELEVARRLKERVQAAAMSRSTFAMMNQLNRPQIPVSAANMPWNTMSSQSLHAHLVRMQQQKQQLGMSAPFADKAALDAEQLNASRVEAQKGLEQLPHTNIRSAKTA